MHCHGFGPQSVHQEGAVRPAGTAVGRLSVLLARHARAAARSGKAPGLLSPPSRGRRAAPWRKEGRARYATFRRRGTQVARLRRFFSRGHDGFFRGLQPLGLPGELQQGEEGIPLPLPRRQVRPCGQEHCRASSAPSYRASGEGGKGHRHGGSKDIVRSSINQVQSTKYKV